MNHGRRVNIVLVQPYYWHATSRPVQSKYMHKALTLIYWPALMLQRLYKDNVCTYCTLDAAFTLYGMYGSVCLLSTLSLHPTAALFVCMCILFLSIFRGIFFMYVWEGIRCSPQLLAAGVKDICLNHRTTSQRRGWCSSSTALSPTSSNSSQQMSVLLFYRLKPDLLAD